MLDSDAMPLVYVVQSVHVDDQPNVVLGVFSDEDAAEDYADAMWYKLADGKTSTVVIAVELDHRGA